MPEYKTVQVPTNIGYEFRKTPNGGGEWYLDGVYHREGGPAVKGPPGYEAWYLNSKRHRPDGPAIRYPNGKEAWYLEGTELESDQIETMKHLLVCDISGLPLYINTEFRSVVAWRFKIKEHKSILTIWRDFKWLTRVLLKRVLFLLKLTLKNLQDLYMIGKRQAS